MKHIFKGLGICLTITICTMLQAQVKIGGTPGAPPASAVLEVDGGINRALLMPRLTVDQINAIANPVAGLTAYGTNVQAMMYFDGAKWRQIQEVLAPFTLPHTGVYIVNNNPVLQLTNNGLNAPAIHGISSEAAGIHGFSTDAIGVRGQTTNGFGINATSLGGAATYARSESGTSMHLYHQSPTGRALIVDAGRVGIGTNNPLAHLHVENNDVLFSAPFFDFGPVLPVPVSGAGRRIMWLQQKAAFRAGRVAGTRWNSDSIGEASIAMGLNTLAKNTGSVAMGLNAAARGEGAIALGSGNQANGNFSLAAGEGSLASANHAIAIGKNAVADGSPLLSIALGGSAKSTGNYTSLAIGSDANANDGIAIGSGAVAKGIALGYDVLNKGFGITIGSFSTTEKDFGISMGYRCFANGENAIAVGVGNTANGINSVSMGINSKAEGASSFTLGLGVTARSRGEVVLGMYNNGYSPIGGTDNFNENDRALIIGHGSGLGTKNAWITLKNGKTGLGVWSPTTDLYVEHFISAPGTITNGFRLQNTGANNNRWTLYTVFSNGDLNLYFNDNGAAKGSFSSSTGAYTASSAAHLKTDFAPMPHNTLEQVMLLRPLRYHYKNDPTQKITIGFIAEEVEPLFPALVEHTGENNEQIGINYAGFSVVAIKAIQELQERVSLLKARVETLKKLMGEE